jgi:hypothetical protein
MGREAGLMEQWSIGLLRLSAIHSPLVAALRVLAGGRMQYFALTMARKMQTPLPGIEEL